MLNKVSQCKSSLRFAIMCNGTTFPKWQAECLKRLLELSNVRAVLLILDDDNVTSGNFFKRVFTRLRNLSLSTIIFELYSYLIVRPSFFRPVDMTDLLPDLPSIRCKVYKRGEYYGYFSEEDIIRIKRFDLDFILRFAFKTVRGDILNAARYGVWSFHLGDEMKYVGVPSCFWEIYNGDPIIGATLKRLTDQVGGIILRKGFFPTIPYSYVANLRRILLETSCWPAQVCIDILNGNSEYFNASTSQTTAPIYYTPTNFQMALFLLKMLKNFFMKKYNRLFCHEEWNIGIIREPISALLKTDAKPTIQWLPKPGKNHYLADPFVVAKDDKIYILCEDFDYNSNKGVISSIELNRSNSIVKKEIVLRTPYHLSYPFLLEHQNEFYCIPESSDAREVALYKAEHFPSHWTKVCTLIEDFPGVDSTVFQYEGRWWLTCANEEDGRKYKLFIWHAPEPSGPWEPHELNPVKIDVGSSCPAGTPFVYEECLYRPAQDCSVTYGGRVVLNRIVRLTPTAFKEEPIWSIEPDRNSLYRDGLHTISVAGNITVVDGKRHVFSMRAFVYTVLSILKDLSARLVKKSAYSGYKIIRDI